MTLLERIRERLDAIVFRGFRIRNFVAVMGVKDPRELAALLDEDNLETDARAQPYGAVCGLHNLRWILFDPNNKNGVTSVSIEGEPQALVLSLVFDGNLDDALGGLLAKAGERVRKILSFCIGFDPDTDVRAFLKERETPSGYFFRDLGPLLIPASEEARKSPSWKAPPPVPDATRMEIEGAHAIWRRFERFQGEHSLDPPEKLRKAFRAEFENDAFPLPLTKFERRIDAEESWVRRMIDTARKRQDEGARSSQGVIRRDVHAKGHGLIDATFEVLDIKRPELQVGLFAAPGEYEAVIRPSNGDGRVQADNQRDARGLALRVQIPSNAKIAGAEPRYVFPKESGKQDFVLMNSPVFFATDIRRLAIMSEFDRLEGGFNKFIGALALLASSGGLRQAWLAFRAIRSRLSHPLEAQFHSTTAYSFGKRHVAKYALEPVDPEGFRRAANPADEDSLSLSLKASLEREPITLKFFVYVFGENASPKGVASLVDAVEDATRDWRSMGAEKVHVANVHLRAPQDPTKRMRAAEALHFSPWNALAEHRPLGNLNRARWAAYIASQQYRSARQQPQQQPVVAVRAAE